MPALKAPDRSGWVEHWLAGPGQEVQAGAVIAEVNTGSTIGVLKSDRSGTIRCLVDERVQCRTGELIARIEHRDDVILSDDRIITLHDLVRHVRPYRTSDDEACREIRFQLRLGPLAAIARYFVIQPPTPVSVSENMLIPCVFWRDTEIQWTNSFAQRTRRQNVGQGEDCFANVDQLAFGIHFDRSNVMKLWPHPEELLLRRNRLEGKPGNFEEVLQFLLTETRNGRRTRAELDDLVESNFGHRTRAFRRKVYAALPPDRRLARGDNARTRRAKGLT